MKIKGGSKGIKLKFLKLLLVVWEKFVDRFDVMNMLFIDDDVYKVICNFVNMVIYLKLFFVATRDFDDGFSANGAFCKYFVRFFVSDLVFDFVKVNCFIDG